MSEIDAIRKRFAKCSILNRGSINFLLAHIDGLEKRIEELMAIRIEDLEDQQIAEDENQRLREALEPFAQTKVREQTARELIARIIEVTGDGVWADWIYDLLMKHCPLATQALKEER